MPRSIQSDVNEVSNDGRLEIQYMVSVRIACLHGNGLNEYVASPGCYAGTHYQRAPKLSTKFTCWELYQPEATADVCTAEIWDSQNDG